LFFKPKDFGGILS